MDNEKKIKNKFLRVFATLLEVIAFIILAYILLFPFYPNIKYKFMSGNTESITNVSEISTTSDITLIKEQIKKAYNSFPESEYSVSKNRLIIAKIGVNAPIVESNNEEYGLNRGAWHMPNSSTPNKGGNTVITGHRFKYLPPNNVTFYLFHKLETGDIVSVVWENEEYVYKVRETKIVPATEVSILNPSSDNIITMFTCDPIYSTKNRLVVVAEQI